jgi:type I restriction enzyme, S subunit
VTSGWPVVALGSITDLITKGTTPTSIGFEFEEVGVKFVKVESINEAGGFIAAKLAHISEECNAALRRSQLQSGDILFSIAGALGRTARVVPDILPANTNQALAIVRLKKSAEIIPDFILYALSPSLLREQTEGQQAGAAQQNLSLTQLKGFEIPLPPAEQQQRIVAILDEAFAGLATATANAEKNLKNARDLFDSCLQAVFTHEGEDWKTVSLGEVCSISSKLVDPREPTFIDLPHLGAGNMASKTGEISDIKTAREERLKSGKFLFDGTMVLYSKIRPYLMKACRPDFDGLCSADVYPLLPDPAQLDRNFLFHLLMSKQFTDFAISGSDRAGMPKVNRNHLFKYRVTLPSINEQVQLAFKLDAISTETRRLDTFYERKLADLANLKQSILRKAFSGELTSPPSSAIKEAAE